MQITHYRKVDKGGLIAEFSLLLSNGIELRALKLCKTGDREFIGWPSRKFQDKDGNPKYFNYIYIHDKDVDRRFQARCLELLEPHRKVAEGTGTQEDLDIPF